MTGRELLAWGDLDDRRRRRDRRGLGRLSPWALGVLAGAVIAAELLRRGLGASDAARPAALTGASQLWIAMVIATHAVLVFGAPFRLYWRRDSALLARLAIRGRSLFALGLLRTARATALLAVPAVIGAVAFGVAGDWAMTARHLGVWLAAAISAACLGPAAALAAGAVIASDRAQAMIESFGGELAAPKTTWLGALPGFAATAVVVAILAAAPWATGGRPPGGSALGVILPAILVPIAALAWAWSVADRVMLAAVREVAALDREILAHVDRSTASALERATARLACTPRGRILFDKDARLARRRYPSAYFLVPLGVIALWIVAVTRSEASTSWAGVLLGCLAAYSLIMARRLAVPPIEHPRLLRSLAFTDADVRSAKRAPIYLRVLVFAGLGGAPLVALSPSTWAAASLVGAAALVALAFGLGAATNLRDDDS